MSPFFGPKEQVDRQLGRLRCFAARDPVFFVRNRNLFYKLCRISFGSDGSIYEQFPYLETSKSGILAEAVVDVASFGPVTYDLGANGVTVSTDVKFSHHTSGIVQFSQTGKIDYAPRRQSFPLNGPIGHVFKIHAYRLWGSTELTKTKKGVLHLGFNFHDAPATAAYIRAEWRRRKDIIKNISVPWGTAGPEAKVYNRKTREHMKAFFLGQPDELPLQDHVLVITGGSEPLPNGLDTPGMVFLGGWDQHERKPEDPIEPLGTCLAFLYPAEKPSGENQDA